MINIFLEKDGKKEFYVCIGSDTPQQIVVQIIQDIMHREKCGVITRQITGTGTLLENAWGYSQTIEDV